MPSRRAHPARPVCRPVLERIRGALRNGAVRRDALAEMILADPVLAHAVTAEAKGLMGDAMIGPLFGVPTALEVLGRPQLAACFERVATEHPAPEDRKRYLIHLRHVLVTSLCAEALAEVVGEVHPTVARFVGLVGPAWPGDAVCEPELEKRPGEIAISLGSHRSWAAPTELSLADRASFSSLLDLAVGMAPRFGAPAAGPTRFGEDESASLALLEAASIVTERVERHLREGLLVLGVHLGIPNLTSDRLLQAIESAWETSDRVGLSLSGLGDSMRRALEGLDGAHSERAALAAVRDALLDLGGTRAVYLALDRRGEEVFLRGEERPCYVPVDSLPATTRRHSHGDRLSWTAAWPGNLAGADLASIPIEVGGNPVAALGIDRLDPNDRVVVAAGCTLARALGARLEAIQLETAPFLAQDRIRRDNLTGTLSRGALTERLAVEVHRSSRSRSPLALLMIDIDRFKEWNDHHGHQVGDEVLAIVGDLLLSEVRESDAVGRYGGDEFVVILPGLERDEAMAVCERIEECTAQIAARLASQYDAPPLGLSVGLASAGDAPIDAETLLFRADHALYRVKRERRATQR